MPLAIHAEADSGYGGVVDAFKANFRERGDVGAACAIYMDGRKVIDLWGGTADKRSARPWVRSTPALIFSCSKLEVRALGTMRPGGQLGFADDESGVGSAYLSNQMGGLVDARATELMASFMDCPVAEN